MYRFVSVLGAVYFIALIFLVPQAILATWDLTFTQTNQRAAGEHLAHVLVMSIFGWLLLAALIKVRRASLQRRIQQVRPPDFKTSIELYGPHDTEYFAISEASWQIIAVDYARRVSLCESLSFLQGWTIENDGARTFLQIRFNSLNFSSMQIAISAGTRHELAAKLNTVMGQYGH